MQLSPQSKKIIKWCVVFGVLLLLIIVYRYFNPLDSVLFPKCPVKLVTGLDCPGCGSQRAIHSLLNFNIKEAFKANALLVLFIPYLMTGFVFDMVNSSSERFLTWRKILFGKKAIYIILIVIVLFTIIRNII